MQSHRPSQRTTARPSKGTAAYVASAKILFSTTIRLFRLGSHWLGLPCQGCLPHNAPPQQGCSAHVVERRGGRPIPVQVQVIVRMRINMRTKHNGLAGLHRRPTKVSKQTRRGCQRSTGLLTQNTGRAHAPRCFRRASSSWSKWMCTMTDTLHTCHSKEGLAQGRASWSRGCCSCTMLRQHRTAANRAVNAPKPVSGAPAIHVEVRAPM